jgi:hypothetical protein
MSDIDGAQADIKVSAEHKKGSQILKHKAIYEEQVDKLQDLAAQTKTNAPTAASYVDGSLETIYGDLNLFAQKGADYIKERDKSDTVNPEQIEKRQGYQGGSDTGVSGAGAGTPPPPENAPAAVVLEDHAFSGEGRRIENDIDNQAAQLNNDLGQFEEKFNAISFTDAKIMQSMAVIDAVWPLQDFAPGEDITYKEQLMAALNGEYGLCGILKFLNSDSQLPQEYADAVTAQFSANYQAGIDGLIASLNQSITVRDQFDMVSTTDSYAEYIDFTCGCSPAPCVPWTPEGFALPPAEKERIQAELGSISTMNSMDIMLETCPPYLENFWLGQKLMLQGDVNGATDALSEFLATGVAAMEADPRFSSQANSFKQQAEDILEDEDVVDQKEQNKEFFEADKFLREGDYINAKISLKQYMSRMDLPEENFSEAAAAMLQNIAALQMEKVKALFAAMPRPGRFKDDLTMLDAPPEKRQYFMPAERDYFNIAQKLKEIEAALNGGTISDFDDAVAEVMKGAPPWGTDVIEGSERTFSRYDVFGDEVMLGEGRPGILKLARKYTMLGDAESLAKARIYYQDYFSGAIKTKEATMDKEQVEADFLSSPDFQQGVRQKLADAKTKYEAGTLNLGNMLDKFGGQRPAWDVIAEIVQQNIEKTALAAATTDYATKQLQINKLEGGFMGQAESQIIPEEQKDWDNWMSMNGWQALDMGIELPTTEEWDTIFETLAVELPIMIALGAISGGAAGLVGGAVRTGLMAEATLAGLTVEAFEASRAARLLILGAEFATEATTFTLGSALVESARTGNLDNFTVDNIGKQFATNALFMGVLKTVGAFGNWAKMPQSLALATRTAAFVGTNAALGNEFDLSSALLLGGLEVSGAVGGYVKRSKRVAELSKASGVDFTKAEGITKAIFDPAKGELTVNGKKIAGLTAEQVSILPKSVRARLFELSPDLKAVIESGKPLVAPEPKKKEPAKKPETKPEGNKTATPAKPVVIGEQIAKIRKKVPGMSQRDVSLAVHSSLKEFTDPAFLKLSPEVMEARLEAAIAEKHGKLQEFLSGIDTEVDRLFTEQHAEKAAKLVDSFSPEQIERRVQMENERWKQEHNGEEMTPEGKEEVRERWKTNGEKAMREFETEFGRKAEEIVRDLTQLELERQEALFRHFKQVNPDIEVVDAEKGLFRLKGTEIYGSIFSIIDTNGQINALRGIADFVRAGKIEGVEARVVMSGSGAQKETNPFPTDIDMAEFIHLTGATTRVQAGELMEKIVRDNYERTKGRTDIEFVEMKLGKYPEGVEPSYKPKNSHSKEKVNRNAKGEGVKWFAKDIEQGYKDVALSENADIPALEAQGYDVVDNPKKPGKKMLRITLEKAGQDPGLFKIDWRGFDHEGKITEITKVSYVEAPNVADFSGTTSRSAAVREVHMEDPSAMLGDVMERAMDPTVTRATRDFLVGSAIDFGLGEGNYLKAAKKLYGVAKITGNAALMKELAGILQSPYGKLHQVQDRMNMVAQALATEGGTPLDKGKIIENVKATRKLLEELTGIDAPGFAEAKQKALDRLTKVEKQLKEKADQSGPLSDKDMAQGLLDDVQGPLSKISKAGSRKLFEGNPKIVRYLLEKSPGKFFQMADAATMDLLSRKPQYHADLIRMINEFPEAFKAKLEKMPPEYFQRLLDDPTIPEDTKANIRRIQQEYADSPVLVDLRDGQPARVFVGAEVEMSSEIASLQRQLQAIDPNLVPHAESLLHVTVGHIGKSAEVLSELEAVTGKPIDKAKFERAFTQLLQAADQALPEGQSVKITKITQFSGRSGLSKQIVAEIENTAALDAARQKVYDGAIQMLRQMGIENPEAVLKETRSIRGLDKENYHPHVTVAEWKKVEKGDAPDIRDRLPTVVVSPEAKVSLKPSKVVNTHKKGEGAH